ncbi:hypothetical protein K435DRAFT_799459 [Dendrothele bispora CBS 962.96]|uniref:Uncharacterized protein n=1 Tax=Dendrothele bispora (strain CBS 962.96) TaxID=1314807 RepID=A0A4S8LVN3_DENBC|nr:hypothetical protein K435DRAFT_799459 [Dendrothele bispora CBS 962.96]
MRDAFKATQMIFSHIGTSKSHPARRNINLFFELEAPVACEGTTRSTRIKTSRRSKSGLILRVRMPKDNEERKLTQGPNLCEARLRHSEADHEKIRLALARHHCVIPSSDFAPKQDYKAGGRVLARLELRVSANIAYKMNYIIETSPTVAQI